MLAYYNPDQPVWQPCHQAMPEDLASFEVFRSLEAGQRRYPHIARRDWRAFPVSAVEKPTILG